MGSSMITINQDKLKEIKLCDCKAKVKQLLSNSDWSETPSSLELLENGDAWIAYRISLKKLLINPVEAPMFPEKPEVRWKS